VVSTHVRDEFVRENHGPPVLFANIYTLSVGKTKNGGKRTDPGMGHTTLHTIKRRQERKAVMKMIRPLLALLMLAAVLAGCASGPKPADLEVAMPALKPGYGRIYFLRSSAFFGSPVQPEILLNNQVVGRSRARGFFFVDRPAGPYQARTSTSVTSTLTFDLYPGETKYVRTELVIALMGIMPGSMAFTLMDESVGEPELRKLSYTGRTVKPEPKQAPQRASQPMQQPMQQPMRQPMQQPETQSVPQPVLQPLPASCIESATC
jgi:hypothetical protein